MKPSSEDAAYSPALTNRLLGEIRAKAPLVHHITNWVTIADCAQITRAVGALPVMAHMEEEVAEMVRLAGALVLNIGTLTPGVVAAMETAGKAANAAGVPVILDMVGCGATAPRTAAVARLLGALRCAVVKGNAGEVGAAAGMDAQVRGVESVSAGGDVATIAAGLAAATGAVVVATGRVDLIADGRRLHRCSAGHPLMGEVVGTGCMAGSILAAFAATSADRFDAAVCAMQFYGKAGERAAESAGAPMAFKAALIDAVYAAARAV